jgi:hypothetical protein
VVDRRRVLTLLSTRLFNPLVKTATNAGLAVPGIADQAYSGCMVFRRLSTHARTGAAA